MRERRERVVSTSEEAEDGQRQIAGARKTMARKPRRYGPAPKLIRSAERAARALSALTSIQSIFVSPFSSCSPPPPDVRYTS